MNNDIGNINVDSLAKERLLNLFDKNSFTEFDSYLGSEVITGFGDVNGRLVYAFSQDISVNNGSIGELHCNKIIKLYELAIKTGNPIVGIFDSNGIKITENHDALNGYGKILSLANNLSGVVPQISLIVGTCGGCGSLIASSSDIIIMSEKAEFFLTPPFVSKSLDNSKINESNSCNFAAKAGSVHICEADETSCIDKARNILSLFPENNLSKAPIFNSFENNNYSQLFSNLDLNNINMEDLAIAISDSGSMVPILSNYTKSCLTSFSTIDGTVVGIVGLDKINGPFEEKGCSKASRFIRLCDSFGIPIITMVDSKGFIQSRDSEYNGLIKYAANLSHAYAEATCPKISVIVGEIYGSAYITFASKNANNDVTMAWSNSVVAALEPETAVEVLWHDELKNCKDVSEKRKELISKYKQTIASPLELLKKGYIDNVISPEKTRDKILLFLDMLRGKRVSKLPKKHSNTHL